jgi:hypothetical protein
MRCVINVILGNKTPKQRGYAAKQEELRASLAEHFDGKFLSWTSFPNDNYDKENPYNAKAAAFEEAMKQGFTQILWVDAPVVAIKDVSPLFDRIEKDGYLLIKNNGWNCAETVSDACLKYFDVSRDEAEEVKEVAGGFIGIDTKNPKGKKLIDTFIQACKDGAANGSRFHNNQSQDPRFRFHRQCQSVITLSAHKQGLKHTLDWNTGPVALDPSKVHTGTIMAWSGRNGHRLNTTRKLKGSYIYFVAYGGLSDNLSELWACTEYAKQHKRTILLKMNQYSATEIQRLFDLSKYPVPIITDKDDIQKLLDTRPLEPPIDLKKDKLIGHLAIKDGKPVRKGTPGSEPLMFDPKKSYPNDTILIWACGGGAPLGNELKFFRHVRLQPEAVKRYKAMVKKARIPEEYVAVHLRATDKKLSLNQNISGLNKTESNHIRKGGVDAFIEKYDMPTYVASDNKHVIEGLKKKFPKVIHSDAAYKAARNNATVKVTGLHRNGKTNPDILIDAVLDLIVLAKAKVLMTSTGGYSLMAKDLWEHKDVVEHLLRN